MSYHPITWLAFKRLRKPTHDTRHTGGKSETRSAHGWNKRHRRRATAAATGGAAAAAAGGFAVGSGRCRPAGLPYLRAALQRGAGGRAAARLDVRGTALLVGFMCLFMSGRSAARPTDAVSIDMLLCLARAAYAPHPCVLADPDSITRLNPTPQIQTQTGNGPRAARRWSTKISCGALYNACVVKSTDRWKRRNP